MMYQLYQAQADLLFPLRQFARIGAGLARLGRLRRLHAAADAAYRGRADHVRRRRPDACPAAVRHRCRGGGRTGRGGDRGGGRRHAVRHAAALPQGRTRSRSRACCWWRRCRATSPRCCAAPSQVMLPEHDLYITDWKNARDVPLAEGRFGFDEFVDHIIRFLRVMGPGSHVVAVCQPAVPALAAAAVMAEAGDPATPRSMTLMAGPIDTRVNPTKVNELAQVAADRVVRAAPDQRGALALSRRVPPCLSGLRAAFGVHEHEPGPAHQRAFRPVPQPGRRRPRQRGGASAGSTTNTAR